MFENFKQKRAIDGQVMSSVQSVLKHATIEEAAKDEQGALERGKPAIKLPLLDKDNTKVVL